MSNRPRHSIISQIPVWISFSFLACCQLPVPRSSIFSCEREKTELLREEYPWDKLKRIFTMENGQTQLVWKSFTAFSFPVFWNVPLTEPKIPPLDVLVSALGSAFILLPRKRNVSNINIPEVTLRGFGTFLLFRPSSVFTRACGRKCWLAEEQHYTIFDGLKKLHLATGLSHICL